MVNLEFLYVSLGQAQNCLLCIDFSKTGGDVGLIPLWYYVNCNITIVIFIILILFRYRNIVT